MQHSALVQTAWGKNWSNVLTCLFHTADTAGLAVVVLSKANVSSLHINPVACSQSKSCQCYLLHTSSVDQFLHVVFSRFNCFNWKHNLQFANSGQSKGARRSSARPPVLWHKPPAIYDLIAKQGHSCFTHKLKHWSRRGCWKTITVFKS